MFFFATIILPDDYNQELFKIHFYLLLEYYITCIIFLIHEPEVQ